MPSSLVRTACARVSLASSQRCAAYARRSAVCSVKRAFFSDVRREHSAEAQARAWESCSSSSSLSSLFARGGSVTPFGWTAASREHSALSRVFSVCTLTSASQRVLLLLLLEISPRRVVFSDCRVAVSACRLAASSRRIVISDLSATNSASRRPNTSA
ncbi:hypothetical protein C8J57DRAFT_1370873 [Mycena rebaudengoi]|nr:hypothetical protein C8J57DRAFT_1370873 [Mycena rebaudengoi]